MKIWSDKKTGIIRDEENSRVIIFAGNAVVQLDGENGIIALQGSVRENNGGDRKEDNFIKKTPALMQVIPSTVATPIAQATIDFPIGDMKNIIQDMSVMMSFI